MMRTLIAVVSTATAIACAPLLSAPLARADEPCGTTSSGGNDTSIGHQNCCKNRVLAGLSPCPGQAGAPTPKAPPR